MTTGLINLLPKTVAILFCTYLGFRLLDFLLGTLKTFTQRTNEKWKSSKMRDGIIKWIAELVAIVFVIALDIVLGLNFLLCTTTLGLFIFREGGSIIENLGECGVNLPDIIKKNLEVFNPENKNKGAQ